MSKVAALARVGANIRPTYSGIQASWLPVMHTSYGTILPGRAVRTSGIPGSQGRGVDIKGLWKSEEACLPTSDNPGAIRTVHVRAGKASTDVRASGSREGPHGLGFRKPLLSKVPCPTQGLSDS